MSTDIIDHLVGVDAGSTIDKIRRQRDNARISSQDSHDALFATDQTEVSQAERLAVAAFVAALHQQSATRDYYRNLLDAAAGADLTAAVDEASASAITQGPYGRFPDSTDLHAEDSIGLEFTVPEVSAAKLGERLTAAFEHAHLLVFRPRESSPAALARLLAAGWSTTAVVTLSQLVSFLSFQLREIHGLTVLKEAQS
jgi:CMD domain protein